MARIDPTAIMVDVQAWILADHYALLRIHTSWFLVDLLEWEVD